MAMNAPDETLYNMPPDTGGQNQWIYGDPNLDYNGQPASNGVDGNVVFDTVPGSPDSSPMHGNMGGSMAAMNGMPPSIAGGSGMPGTVINGTAPGAAAIAGMNGEPVPGGVSSAAAQSLRMKNPVSMELTHMPTNASEAYQASLRSLLHRNIGYFVVATFLVGTQQSITWQGILHTVGSDYFVLYQPDYERYISCDLYALKFVQFHNSKGVPYCAASQNWQSRVGIM